jgi:hypothetical protein
MSPFSQIDLDIAGKTCRACLKQTNKKKVVFSQLLLEAVVLGCGGRRALAVGLKYSFEGESVVAGVW